MPEAGKSLTMGMLAKQAGCNVETVRYYEKAGLMPEAPRSPGGHRRYSRSLLRRLCFIRRTRELGFPVEQVRALLRLVDEPRHTCAEVREIAIAQANAVQERIDDLQRLQGALSDMARRCSGGRSSVDDCPIVETLFAEAREADDGARNSEPRARENQASGRPDSRSDERSEESDPRQRAQQEQPERGG